MAIVLIEEVLVGLEDVKASLEQAITTLHVLVDDLPPHFGETLRTAVEQELLQPLQRRLTVLEDLHATVETLAT